MYVHDLDRPSEKELIRTITLVIADTRFTIRYLERSMYQTFINHLNIKLTHLFNILENEGRTMSERKGNKFNNYSFVNMRLTEIEKKSFVEWNRIEGEITFNDVENIITDGYKISLSFSGEHDMFIVSLTGRPEARFNQYKILTSRHETLEKALALALYKHVVVSQSASWRDDTDEQAWG